MWLPLTWLFGVVSFLGGILLNDPDLLLDSINDVFMGVLVLNLELAGLDPVLESGESNTNVPSLLDL